MVLYASHLAYDLHLTISLRDLNRERRNREIFAKNRSMWSYSTSMSMAMGQGK